jgi:hypothetical protein
MKWDDTLLVTLIIWGKDVPPRKWKNVSLECLPPKVLEALKASGIERGGELPDSEFEILFCRRVSSPPHWATINPWRAREEFLRLPRATKVLIPFLSRFGTWSNHYFNWAQTEDGDFDENFGVIFPNRVWIDQQEIFDALKGGSKRWFSIAAIDSEFSLSVRPEFPHFVHVDEYCLDAIKSSVTFDFLRGVRFGICKRDDCGKPFELSHKGKIYCDQYCGHLVSLRKKRAADRTAKKKGN